MKTQTVADRTRLSVIPGDQLGHDDLPAASVYTGGPIFELALSPNDDVDVDGEALATVQAVAEQLDRVNRAFAKVGPTTLLAEVREMPCSLICAVLEELAEATERAVRTLRS